MQLVNQETYSVTARGNNFFDVVSSVMKKITTALTPPKKAKAKFSNESVAEAIECLEWRVKYDQRRIVTHIYTLAALVQSPKICIALGIEEPTYRSSWFNNNRLVGIQSKTRELLESPKRHTVNPKSIDRFELTLAKFTGFYSSRTQALMSGAGVANAAIHRSLRKRLEDILAYNGDDADMLSLQHNMNVLAHEPILASAPAQLVEEVQSYEEHILNEMSSILDAVEASMKEAQNEVKAVTPVTEPQVTTKQPTKVEQAVQTKLSKKMTIKELKLYAKAHKIHVPGRKTKHRDIFEYIKEAQQA